MKKGLLTQSTIPFSRWGESLPCLAWHFLIFHFPTLLKGVDSDGVDFGK